ncbi:hypothetical protein IEC338SC_2668 [Acinetobacter pittii]|uniref:Uncharacterized protein n=1 Tax=Acinetobacter pittii TaxID=48296 RepID=A0AB33BGF6_ACIPI|nr:hypothetical protein [Acinetobacter pittii]AMX19794.1 hypothetical protein IEC338SC_2668 [Acinetobacter pittii]
MPYTYVSVTVSYQSLVEFLQYVLPREIVGNLFAAFGVVKFFSMFSGAEITSLLGSCGSMALGLGAICLFGGICGKLWNSFWTKLLN